MEAKLNPGGTLNNPVPSQQSWSSFGGAVEEVGFCAFGKLKHKRLETGMMAPAVVKVMDA